MEAVVTLLYTVGDFIIAAVAGEAAVAGVSAITSAIIGATAIIGGTIGLTKLYEIELNQPDTDYARQRTVKGTTVPVKVVYGEALVSGPIAFVGAGNDAGSSGNESLFHVVALTGHESEALTDVYLDNIRIPETDIGTAGSGYSGFVGGTSTVYGPVDGTNITYINKHLGDDTTSDTMIDNAFSKWTSTHQGRGITYLATQFYFPDDEDIAEIWNKYTPNDIKGLVKGVKTIYDPRNDTGGNGNNPANASFQSWSDNPALCLANYLTDQDFGMGIPVTEIDWDSVADAADHCDETVTDPSGSPKRYTCNGVLYGTETHANNVSKLLSAMNGSLVYTNGIYVLNAGEYVAPSVTLTEDDLSGHVTITTASKRSDRFNTITGLYNDPDQNHKQVEFPKVTIAGTKNNRDNGEELSKQIQLSFTNDVYMAQRLAYQMINRSNNQMVMDFPTNLRGLKVAVGDRVQVTLNAIAGPDGDTISFVNKIFVCQNFTFTDSSTGAVNLTLVEDYDGANDYYADMPSNAYSTFNLADGTITDGFSGLSAPTGITATGVDQGFLLDWTNPPSMDSNTKVKIYQDSSSDSTFNISNIVNTYFTTTDFYNVLDVPASTTFQFWFQIVRGTESSSIDGPYSATSGEITADSIPWSDVTGREIGVGLDGDSITLTGVDTDGSTATGQGIAQSGVNQGITATSGGITLNGGGSIKSTGKDSESDSDAGFFLGWNASANSGNGSYTFGVGNSTDYLKYIDGTLTVSGTLSGVDGDFSGTIAIGTGDNIFKADSNGIYLGNAAFASAPFSVTQAGALTATSATITGSIDASTSLTFNGANVTGSLQAGNIGSGQITPSKIALGAISEVNPVTITGNVNRWGGYDEDGTAVSVGTGITVQHNAGALEITNDNNRAIRSEGFEVDHNAIYVIRGSMKKNVALGRGYLGVTQSTSAIASDSDFGDNENAQTTPLTFDRWDKTRTADTSTANAYLLEITSITTSYESFKVFLLGANVNIDDVPEHSPRAWTGFASYPYVRLNASAKYAGLRILNWSNGATTTTLSVKDLSVLKMDSPTIVADNIYTENLAAINADLGAITAGTLKGGTIPDADAAPTNAESGSFFDLTGGKFVVGNATENLLFDGSNLRVTGAITATSLSLSGITIPKSDLESSVQSSLDAADTANQDSTATILGGTLTGTVDSTATIGTTTASDVESGASAGATAIQDGDTGLDLELTAGSVAGINIDSSALYSGSKSTFPSATTAGFILTSDGKIAISDGTQNVLSFDPTATEVNLNIQGSITAGSGSNTAALSGTEAYRFWAGSDNPALGTFRVDSQGQVVATNFILTDANNNILFSTADGFEPLAITQIAAGSGEAAKVTEYAESLTGDTDDIQITLSQTSNIQIKVRITCFWYGAEFAATDAAARTAAENELLQSVNLLVGYSATSGGAFTSSQNQSYTKVIDSATPTSTQINVETATSYDAESGTYLGTAVPLAGSGALNANKEIVYTATFNSVPAGTYYVRSTVTATNDTATGGAGSASSNLKESNDSTYSRTVSIIDNTTDGGFTVDGGANQTVGGGDITSVSITANNGISGGGTVSSGAANFTLGLGNITPTSVTTTSGGNFRTNSNANPLQVSRLGGTDQQVLNIGVTDTQAIFNYIEDTSSEGSGNYGSYLFQLSGDSAPTGPVNVLALDENAATFYENITANRSGDGTKTRLRIQGGAYGFDLNRTNQTADYAHLRPINDGSPAVFRIMPNTSDNFAYMELWNSDFEADTVNYSRGMVYYDTSNILTIQTNANGTGVAGDIKLRTNSTDALTIDTSQNATFAGTISASAANLTGTLLLEKQGTATASVTAYNSETLQFRASGWDTNNETARDASWKVRSIPTASIYPDHDLTFIESDQGAEYTKFVLHGRGSTNYTDPLAASFYGNVDINAGTGVTSGPGNLSVAGDASFSGLIKSTSEIQFDRGSSNFTNYIRANNYPDQGYTQATDKYWIEYGAQGGHHFVLNTDGGAGAAENAYDHFTVWQGAIGGDRVFYVKNTGNVVAAGGITWSGGSSANANTAYNWGDHSVEGYLTGNQTITLSGDASGSGTTSIAVTVANDSHNHTTFTVNGITDLNSISGTGVLTFRPFISEFQAANRSGANYNGGFEVGTRATGYGSQFVFEANSATTPPKFRNKTSGTWGAWQTVLSQGSNISVGAITATSQYGGGSGDFTNVTTPPLKLVTTAGTSYLRVPHISANSTISTVYNYETGKNVYWGEPTDTGAYYFRGRTFFIENNSTDNILSFKTTSTTADPVIQMNGQGGIATEGFEIWYDNNIGDVHFHTTYDNSDAAIRFHTRTGASKSTSNERFAITGDGDIQVSGTTVINSSRNVTAGSGYFYVAGTSNTQTTVLTLGSNSTRPLLQFSESASTGITSGMSLEYNGFASGVSNYMAVNSVAGSPVFRVYSGGNIQSTGNVTAYASDARLKTNIKPIESALEKVQLLRGVEFDWRDDVEEKGFNPSMSHETGVIAQEVQEVIPDAVVPAPFDENYLTVQHEKIIPLLIESVKELTAQVEELQKKLKEK